jgi:SAM-dependent methyltransferase
MSSNSTDDVRSQSIMQDRDYLWLNLRALPYFRALMRSFEARFYREIALPQPILDIGCGDGHFASVAFNQPLDMGLDPWKEPIQEAVHWNAYNHLVLGDATEMPFPDNYFYSAISNSVLEHIPSLDEVLVETARILKQGAPFVFCVPNHNFLSNLSIGQFLDRLGLNTMGNMYRSFFNRISRHYHCDPPQVWFQRLALSGFEVVDYWHYYPPEALHITEWGHYMGAPALLTRKLTGKWIIFPSRRNPFLRYIEKSLRPLYDRDDHCENGVCTFYVTRKAKH